MSLQHKDSTQHPFPTHYYNSHSESCLQHHLEAIEDWCELHNKNNIEEGESSIW